MTRRLSEQVEMRERETLFDGTINETRFFRVSRQTYKWLKDHGQLATVQLCHYWPSDTIISVSAFIEDWGNGEQWNGWHWIHDEFANSGMNPGEYGI